MRWIIGWAIGWAVLGCGDDDGGPVDTAGEDVAAFEDGAEDASAGDDAPATDDAPPAEDAAETTDHVGPGEPDECLAPGADWVFCSSFEEGDFGVWDDYDGNPPETNVLLEDPGPAGLAGNHVARLRVPPGRGGADLVKVLPGEYDRLYARWYVRWEPGYDFDAPNHGGGLHAGSRDYLGRSDYRPDGTDWFGAWLEPVAIPAYGHVLNVYSYYRGMYMDCADPSGSCWGDHFPCMVDEGATYCERPEHRETTVPPDLETGRWYCLELLVDGGTPSATEAGAGGTLDWWIDGLEIGPWTPLWFRTTAELRLTILWLSLFHHEEHSVEGLYLDNVVVGTSRIGCLGD
ncbi:MAG: hypothetical protein JXB32_10840 [Deltaproteobacteria bacterium]|nr:hypothetical protein [Deltaproteobacteria bacterium]